MTVKTNTEVTVLVTTFNHENFVESCFRSLLTQSIVDKIKIVWVDDASTDNTVTKGNSVIDSFNFSNVERLHYKNNRYQRRIPNKMDVYEHLEGEFFAMLDGDDNLADPRKYEKQILLLAGHPEIDISFTKAYEINLSGDRSERIWGDLGGKTGIVSFGGVVAGDGGLMPTATILLRSRKLKDAPVWFWEYQPVGDYLFQVLCSFPNGALYSPETTAEYRVGVTSSWTSTTYGNMGKKFKFHKEFLTLLAEMSLYYPYEHSASFEIIIKSHLTQILRVATAQQQRAEVYSMVMANQILYNAWQKL